MNFFYLEQLPAPHPSVFTEACPWATEKRLDDWLEARQFELTYTAWDMKPFAEALGDEGAPFVWNPKRRATLRAELDAAFFHLYGLDRYDTEYVLSTFPIVNRSDPGLAGRVLESYDPIARAIESGTRFVSTLDPPPEHGARHPGET